MSLFSSVRPRPVPSLIALGSFTVAAVQDSLK